MARQIFTCLNNIHYQLIFITRHVKCQSHSKVKQCNGTNGRNCQENRRNTSAAWIWNISIQGNANNNFLDITVRAICQTEIIVEQTTMLKPLRFYFSQTNLIISHMKLTLKCSVLFPNVFGFLISSFKANSFPAMVNNLKN